ncbi:MAG: class I SAM-dependent methyltransferase [Anaerolineae bacterium]
MPEYDLYATLYDFEYDDVLDDIPFYRDLAVQSGGPALELACGTGRVLIPVAEAGVEVVGLDISRPMLAVAQEKVGLLPPQVQERITLGQGDMRDFDLGVGRFALVYIPFRSFLHLLTVAEQLQALAAIRRSLRPEGRLAMAFFNPRLEYIAPRLTARGATTFLEDTYDLLNGERLLQWACTRYDAFTQVARTERMYDRVGADGRLIERTYRQITVRWLYRYEAEHLFIRAGFEIEALYGDFAAGSFDEQSEEQVWVLRPAGARPAPRRRPTRRSRA